MFALGCVIYFSCCAFRVPFWLCVLGAVLLFFSIGLFVCVFLFVFSLFGLFLVPFWPWVLGRRANFFFGRAFWVCFGVFFSCFMKAILSFFVFLVIFSFLLWPSTSVSLLRKHFFSFLFFGLFLSGAFLGSFFWFRFRSFFAFFMVFALGCVISFSCCAFRVPFWLCVLGAVLLFFSIGLFVCVFVCVFSSFWTFFGPFLVLGAGAPCCFFFGRAFWVCFGVFFPFLWKRFFHFSIFWSFFVFFFSFHFCFDLPQVSVC